MPHVPAAQPLQDAQGHSNNAAYPVAAGGAGGVHGHYGDAMASAPRKVVAPPLDPLPIGQLPAKIRGIVERLDEDITKISSYIQQVHLKKDQFNRYQRHLTKLIA